MVDFPKFFATAAELYSLWPSFFTWAAGLIVPFIAVLVTATWWMRGYKADAREAALEGEKIGLKGQVDVQRLALATEQNKLTEGQVKKFQGELEELKARVKRGESLKELQNFTSNLDTTLENLYQANNAVGHTLTFIVPGNHDVPPVVVPKKKR